MSDQTETQEEEAGFMGRWSQKKNKARLEEQDILKQPLESDKHLPEEIPAENFKTDEDMPPLESLSEESDYSGFLSPKVSDVLRKQALRKLFHLSSMNIVDGLDDYAEDFTKFEGLGNIIPHEMKRMLDREKAKLEAEEEEEAAERERLSQNNINHSDAETEELIMNREDGTESLPVVSDQQQTDIDEELTNPKDNENNE